MSFSQRQIVDVDLLIVGAGPAGLFACFYAGMRDLSVAVIDTLPQVGGQLMELYPEKPIYDVAGLPAATGAELVEALHRQSLTARPVWLLAEQAGLVQREGPGPEARLSVTTNRGTLIRCGAIVVAAGIGSFRPRTLPKADGWEGRGLHYGVKQAIDLAGRHVIVVGGGDSAVDWCNLLSTQAASVTLVHRRRALRAHQSSVNQLAVNGVRVVLDAEVSVLRGGERLEEVEISARATGTETMRVDAVVAALGHIADLGPLREWGLDLDGRHVVVDDHMETSMPGIFAVGDVTTHPGKVRIMATGFGEAATAVNNIAARLRPGESVFPGHSTDVMAPPDVLAASS